MNRHDDEADAWDVELGRIIVCAPRISMNATELDAVSLLETFHPALRQLENQLVRIR